MTNETIDSGSCDGAKVVTLHIIHAILAKSSSFFYKLFKNGMRESQNENDVSLRISESEEASLMDLFNFMYKNTLNASSASDLVDLLIAADKFEVTSCMSYCVETLLKLPMSVEYALVYLELPSSVLVSHIVQPLIDQAKNYIAAHFKDFIKSQGEAMKWPLSTLEVVLGVEGLQVDSKADVCDFVLEWARVSYPNLEERREILVQRLTRFMCFSNMSSPKLQKVLACPDFHHMQVVRLVMRALFLKVELPCGQHIHPSLDLATTNHGFLGRVYRPHCVVYFDLKKEVLRNLPTSTQTRLDSQPFCVGGRRLCVYVQCHKRVQDHHLGLYVKREVDSETCA